MKTQSFLYTILVQVCSKISIGGYHLIWRTGGLSNGIPELIHDSQLGGTFELRDIQTADRGLSPLELWCNEAQERYCIAVAPNGLNRFKAIAKRERCGFAIVGRTQGGDHEEKRLVLMDRESQDHPEPVNLPMPVLFGKVPSLHRIVESRKLELPSFDNSLVSYGSNLDDAIQRVLRLPGVASKSYLITISDRSVSSSPTSLKQVLIQGQVGGLCVRDPMAGRYQVPVADCGVTATSLTSGIKTGEAIAIGEKPTLALINAAASARMAVAEALLNVAASHIEERQKRVKLSANWMSAIHHPGEGAAIYEAVEQVTKFCIELGISIPVGKDSTSMKTKWTDPQTNKATEVTAPLSLVVTAVAPVANICNTWTPALRRDEEEGVGETVVLMVDLAMGHRAMGGSAIAQVFGQIGNEAPDVRDEGLIKDYFDAIEQLHEAGIVLAYHDISDGGLFTCLLEMCIAGRCGMGVMLDAMCKSKNNADVISTLFNEELGAVFQVRKKDETNFHRCFATCGPPDGLIKKIGKTSASRSSSSKESAISIYHGMDRLYYSTISKLHQDWASTSYQMSKLRDNPACADSEYDSFLDAGDPGLSYNLTFKPADNILPFTAKISSRLSLTTRPRVAILREQGTNGQSEMAFAFMSAGFTAVDVHMSDLLSGRESLLNNFRGLAACGGFSYGDVLGAGQGWAKSVLLRKDIREQFANFFAKKDTFTLGVCNGCQFLSRLKALIPGAEAWPTFQRNVSEQYEARFCMVEIHDDVTRPSVFLHGMAGTTMPIALSHAEGRAHFAGAVDQSAAAEALLAAKQAPVRYVDNYLRPTVSYPANPNGSPAGIAGLRSADGRVLAMMPHPERCVRTFRANFFPF